MRNTSTSAEPAGRSRGGFDGRPVRVVTIGNPGTERELKEARERKGVLSSAIEVLDEKLEALQRQAAAD